MGRGTGGHTRRPANATPDANADATPPDANGSTSPPDMSGRILRVMLADGAERRSPLLARDVEQAMLDLAAENSFRPHGLAGPFILHLGLQNGRLMFDIRDADDRPLTALGLALGPFRRIVKDYLLILESHATAAAEGRTPRLEAIDMGRRGLHNEGAELIIARLGDRIDVDFATARRLFTLVCVLHQRH